MKTMMKMKMRRKWSEKAPVKKSAFNIIAKMDKNQTRMEKDLGPSTPR